jgi:hypothetical protein
MFEASRQPTIIRETTSDTKLNHADAPWLLCL